MLLGARAAYHPCFTNIQALHFVFILARQMFCYSFYSWGFNGFFVSAYIVRVMKDIEGNADMASISFRIEGDVGKR